MEKNIRLSSRSKRAIIRIWEGNPYRGGKFVGTGFLIDQALVVTCAHIVVQTWQSQIPIFLTGPPWTGLRKVIDVNLHPERDVAVLEIRSDGLDDDTISVIDVPNEELLVRSAPMQVVGYSDAETDAEEYFIHLKSYVGKSDTMVANTFIAKGVSGSPVFQLGNLIGIVQARNSDKNNTYIVPGRAFEEFILQHRANYNRDRVSELDSIDHNSIEIFQATSPPFHFVEPKRKFEEIKRCLLNTVDSEGGHGDTVALKGLGGVGKSTLAQAICCDAKIQRRFKDGILWVTVGQNPKILSLLETWLWPFEEQKESLNSVVAATAELKRILRDKSALLVVDDVWHAEHLTPFLAGGPACKTLITTRDAQLASYAGGNVITVDVLSEDDAVALLTKRSRLPEPADYASVAKLVNRVGCLPLAVELLAVQLDQGYTPEEVFDDLQEEFGVLSGIEITADLQASNEEQQKKTSLNASLNLSIRRLDRDLVNKFSWLGILKDEASISDDLASILWRTSRREAQRHLRELNYRSLVSLARDERGKRCYKVHDLVREKACLVRTGTDNTLLDLEYIVPVSLSDAHGRFVGDCRNLLSSGKWSSLFDIGEPYLIRNLFWHIEHCSKTDEMFQILDEEVLDAKLSIVSQAWYLCHSKLGRNVDFLDDLERAWRVAKARYDAASSYENKTGEIQHLIKVALYLNSFILSHNIQDKSLLSKLMANNLWSPVQVIALAGLSLSPLELAAVAIETPEPSRTQGIKTALRRIQQYPKVDAKAAELLAVILLLDNEERSKWFRKCFPDHNLPFNNDHSNTLELMTSLLPKLREHFLLNVGSASQYMIYKAVEVMNEYIRSILNNASSVEVEGSTKLLRELESWHSLSGIFPFDQGFERMVQDAVDGLLEIGEIQNSSDRLFLEEEIVILGASASEAMVELFLGRISQRIRRLIQRIESVVTGRADLELSSESPLSEVDLMFARTRRRNVLTNEVEENIRQLVRMAPYLSLRQALLVGEFVSNSETSILTERFVAGLAFDGVSELADLVRSSVSSDLKFLFSMRVVQVSEGRACDIAVKLALDVALENRQELNHQLACRCIGETICHIPVVNRPEFAELILDLKGSRDRVRALGQVVGSLSQGDVDAITNRGWKCYSVVGDLHLLCGELSRCADETAVSEMKMVSLANIVHDIWPEDERIDNILDVVSSYELPSSVTNFLLSVAVESAQKVGGHESLIRNYVSIAALLDEPIRTNILLQPPCYYRSWDQIIRPEKQRRCIYCRLRDLDHSREEIVYESPSDSRRRSSLTPLKPSHNELERGRVLSSLLIERQTEESGAVEELLERETLGNRIGNMARRFGHWPTRSLGRVDVDKKKIQELDSLVRVLEDSKRTATRGEFCSIITDHVAVFALRGDREISCEAVYAMHDCLRWWP